MNNKFNFLKIFLGFFLIVFSFYINYFYANKGLYPIDSFSFFDTGFYVTIGQHPIKDFWIISGIFVDYIQALFFLLFGENWNSYIYHASFFNSFLALFFFFFLNQFNQRFFINFILAISVSILCYPIIGTPFPYQHSLILSLISIFLFYLGIEKKNNVYWILLPFFMTISFLSMQLPSGFINILILTFLIIYFLFMEKYFLKYFVFGTLFSLGTLLLYLFIVNTNLKDVIEQLILFPLSIGEGRIMSEDNAFESAKLLNKLTIRGTLGHFKFINFFILANLIVTYLYLRKIPKKLKLDNAIFLNIFIFFCAISFILHQLITANQTFIFSLIPILCGLLIIQIDKTKIFNENKYFKILLILLVIFSTIKYHQVYNEKRKFIDLQHVNISQAISAKSLDPKLKELKWITPLHYSSNPDEELKFLKEALQVLKDDQDEKMLITHYQFFSLILKDDLNIPNRWYFPNNTFPATAQNEYYKNYLKKFNQKLINRNIKKIYMVEAYPGEFDFLNLKDLLKPQCFKKEKLNKILIKVKLQRC